MPRRSRARRNTQAARATDFDLRRTTRQLLTASPNSPQRHLSGGAPRDSSTNHPTLNKGVVQGSALARTHRWPQVGQVAIRGSVSCSSFKGSRTRTSCPTKECVNHPQFATVFGMGWTRGSNGRPPGGTVETGVRGQGRRAQQAATLSTSIPSQPSGGRASGAYCCDVVVVDVSRLRSLEVKPEVSGEGP